MTPEKLRNTSTRISYFYILFLLSLLTTACVSTDNRHGGKYAAKSTAKQGTRYVLDKDTGPMIGGLLDPNFIADAVPLNEPRTIAGNKSPYTVLGKTYSVMPDSKGYSQEGRASWYGKKFHGYKTSSGEIYDMYQMTGAHRSLPIPSYVRVTNLSNGRTAVVRVNDRGPFHSKRIMDLSYAAAVKLDVVRTGTANVRLDVVGVSDAPAIYANNLRAKKLPKDGSRHQVAKAGQASRRPNTAKAVSAAVSQDSPAAPAYLQAAAFRNKSSAQNLRQKLASLTGHSVSVSNSQGLYKVRIGPFKDKTKLQRVSKQLVLNSFSKPQVVYF
jgi:rare lipoprotein A